LDSSTVVMVGVPGSGAQGQRSVLVRASGVALVAALAAAVFGQGAFFGAVQWPVAFLIFAAVVLAFAAYPSLRADVRGAPGGFVLAGVLFAVWAAVRAVAAGTPAAGLTWALFGAGTAAVLFICRRLDAGSRGLVLDGVFAVGLVVAAAGWLGVVFRHRPWGLDSAGLWRAASTLTYANATAALLVPLALVVLARLTGSPGSVRLSLTAAGLLCGAGATLSRAGAAAFAVGFLLLCALRGTRRVARVAAGPVMGAAVALFGLVPSMPATARAGGGGGGAGVRRGHHGGDPAGPPRRAGRARRWRGAGRRVDRD
jgi:hypothetical protein